MTPTNWWIVLVKLEGLDRRTERRHPEWADELRDYTRRLRAVVADPHMDRLAFVEAIDLELYRLQAGDGNLARRAWIEDQLVTLKAGLLTLEELAELQALADRICGSMAAAQGVAA